MKWLDYQNVSRAGKVLPQNFETPSELVVKPRKRTKMEVKKVKKKLATLL